MNAARRKRIDDALALLRPLTDKMQEIQAEWEEAKSIIDEVAEGEREYYDNMPENMQSSDKGSRADEVASNLESIELDLDGIDFEEVITALEEAKE